MQTRFDQRMGLGKRLKNVVAAACVAASMMAGTSSASAACIADYSGNGEITVQDVFDFLGGWFNSAPAADVNGDMNLTVQDVFDFLGSWFGGCSPELRISASTGGLGSAVTARIVFDGQGAHTFDSATTMRWTGRFEPSGGGTPSSNFQIDFNAAEVIETTSTQALIVLGSGAGTVPSSVISAPTTGQLVGTITGFFAAGSINGSVHFTPSVGGVSWRKIEYPDGIGGSSPPQVGQAMATLEYFPLVASPDPLNPSAAELLYAGVDSHLSVVVDASWSQSAASVAPATRTVFLISVRPDGTEISRETGVVLERETITTGQPIRYCSRLSKPIILVDTVLQNSPFAEVHTLSVESGAKILVAPQ